MEQERYEEVQAILEDVTKFRLKQGDGSAVGSMMNLGVAYFQKGQLDLAEKYLRMQKLILIASLITILAPTFKRSDGWDA